MALEQTTAVIQIAPGADSIVTNLYAEARKLQEYAEKRIIEKNEDLGSATEDVSLIANLKKALEAKRKEYTGPVRDHLDSINATFKTIMAPVEEADRITREKIMAFRREQERKRAEAEAIDRERQELARREAELSGTGETTIDLTPVAKPEAVPDKVHTEVGTTGTMKVYKWELVDIALVPKEYIMVNGGMITSVVKASKGKIIIPGIKVWEEDTLRVTAAK